VNDEATRHIALERENGLITAANFFSRTGFPQDVHRSLTFFPQAP